MAREVILEIRPERPQGQGESIPPASVEPGYVMSSIADGGTALAARSLYGSWRAALPDAPVKPTGLSDTAAAGTSLHDHDQRIPGDYGVRSCSDDPRWIGSVPESICVGSQMVDLSFCYVGSTPADPDNPALIDPELEIALAIDAPLLGSGPVAYRSLSPAQRGQYLRWIADGRRSSAVPRTFLLQFLGGLEHAIVRDERLAEIVEVRAELGRLLDMHNDDVFARYAEQLIAACEILQPDYCPEPVYASAETNYRAEMPFKVRHFLGWMLKHAGRLEADAGLVLYLQQPGTRLDRFVAQYFRELHEQWCHQFPQAVADQLPPASELPRLSFAYEAVVGNFSRVLRSDLPEVSGMPLPQAMNELFDSIVNSLEHLRHEPVGRITTNMPVPGIVASKATKQFTPRAGAAAHLEVIVPDAVPRSILVSDLLEILVDEPAIRPGKLLERTRAKQVTKILAELGFGLEPDSDFLLPNSLRPASRVALFRTEKLPNDEPTDAYLLVQAAVLLSALAQRWFPSLSPFDLGGVEQRLPYRHRFTDRELRRLEATGLAIAHLEKPRIFLGRWITLLARDRRLDRDLVGGFGLAFRGQRRNSELARHARAVSLAREGLIDVEALLAAASATEIPPANLHVSLEQRVQRMVSGVGATNEAIAAHASAETSVASGDHPLPPALGLQGLESRHAELLLALSDRARTREEFVEIARTRRLTLVGAVDRINEWAVLAFGAPAISEDDNVAITLQAADYLADQAARS